MNLDFNLTGHNAFCPRCKTHLTSLYLCPECGVRFDEWHTAEALAASRLELLEEVLQWHRNYWDFEHLNRLIEKIDAGVVKTMVEKLEDG